jgi:hypothetical protein
MPTPTKKKAPEANPVQGFPNIIAERGSHAGMLLGPALPRKPTMCPESEKREFTRVPISFQVDVLVGGRRLTGCVVRDLSMKGMLVVTGERFPPGTPCEAVINLVEGAVEIRTSGVVAATHPLGFGMEFSTIDGLESYIHLRNLVLFNAPDVERVEEELQSHSGIKRKE